MKTLEEYPEPTQIDLLSDDFNAIWDSIKKWDISRHNDGLYSGPTGNDVMHILQKVRPVLLNTYKAGMSAAATICDDCSGYPDACNGSMRSKRAILSARDKKVI